MKQILQGTTPAICIEIDPEDLSLSDVQEIELAFQQREAYPMIKHTEDCEIDEDANTVTYHFTEQETQSFNPKYNLKWQIRFLTNGEIVGTRIDEIDILDLISTQAML